MKRYLVRLTEEVESDLLDLFEYIARKDSIENAWYVLNKLDTLILSLGQQPERGRHPPELHKHGVKVTFATICNIIHEEISHVE